MTRLTVLLSAILAAAALRLVPHPPNFSPIDAMALFSGAYLGRRWIAFVAPLAALLLSDLALGFYAGMTTVYATVALIVVIGWWVSSRRTPLRIGTAAIAGSVAFFAITTTKFRWIKNSAIDIGQLLREMFGNSSLRTALRPFGIEFERRNLR